MNQVESKNADAKAEAAKKLQAAFREHQVRKVEKANKEKQEQINKNKNITLGQFKSLLAGNQHVGNRKIIDGKDVEVDATCGVHVITTLKNIYDYIGGKKEGFIQGFNNVIDNFLVNGGTADRIFKPTGFVGHVGEALTSGDFKGFLQKNKIGMHRINFFEFVDKSTVLKDHKTK